MWGYYRFIELFEASKAHLIGGQPDKQAARSKSAKGEHGPVVDDLAVLYRKDTAHYERLIAGTLDHDLIDGDGFTSIPPLVDLSKAIGPDTCPASNRLTDRALSRVRRDTTSDDPSEVHWSPTPVTGPWSELVNNKRIKDLQADVDRDLSDDTYQLTPPPEYGLDRAADCSDFEDENGPTALPPGSDEEDIESDNADQEDEEEREDPGIKSKDGVNSPKSPTPPSSPVARTPSLPKRQSAPLPLHPRNPRTARSTIDSTPSLNNCFSFNTLAFPFLLQ
ncbi:unnamed protein product [Phytophthora fragariaefolia]|uniref:Unnamed protein product n=1 Tax=Phytophthora fragariaefolia TaxID=1490495 RepID=A0A9W7CWC6_9STRA|nr:unnamed protein product [Phytophthora fragariaefolia]